MRPHVNHEDDAMTTTFPSRYVSFFPVISSTWFGLDPNQHDYNEGNAATATGLAAVDVLASDHYPLRTTSNLHLTH